MKVSEELKTRLIQNIEADFSEQQSLKQAVWNEYQDDIQHEVFQMAVSEGYPSEMNVEDLDYEIEVIPQGSIEAVTEHYIAFLEETSTNIESDITNTELRHNEFVNNAEQYLDFDITILESSSTFKEAHTTSSVSYLAQQMRSYFDDDEYLRFITRDGETLHESEHNPYLMEKIRDAYADEGLDVNEVVKVNGFAHIKITHLRPFTPFEDIAERFSERIETQHKTIQHYLESRFYTDLEATNEIDFDVIVTETNEDMIVYFAIDPEDLDPIEIEHTIRTETNMTALKRRIALQQGYHTDEALHLATDPDRKDLWLTELVYPDTFSKIQDVAEDALRHHGVFTRRMFNETSDKGFLYDTLHGGCMIACEIGEEESHAYCLTLELNQEALDESLNE